jgi:hypothetical protein
MSATTIVFNLQAEPSPSVFRMTGNIRLAEVGNRAATQSSAVTYRAAARSSPDPLTRNDTVASDVEIAGGAKN